ncbi:MAG: dethiobiotin synthase [Gemmatimonadaceae bacterium]
MTRLAITGTDTGVGKTIVATALIAALRADGRRVAAFKPVETGVAAADPASDGALLRAAAGNVDALADVRPVVLPEPLAPWIAARRAGSEIDLEALDTAFERLASRCDVLVVEGAGGLLVPVTATDDYAALFRRWSLDLIVVAANRLGALNHTLLTVRAGHAEGLRVRGVVLNDAAPHRAGVAERTNADALRTLLAGIPLVTFPWMERPRDAKHLAQAARTSGLCRLAGFATEPEYEGAPHDAPDRAPGVPSSSA